MLGESLAGRSSARAWRRSSNATRCCVTSCSARPSDLRWPPPSWTLPSLLLAGYGQARERLDVPRWARSQGKGLTDAGVVAERFAFLGRRRIASAHGRGRGGAGRAAC